MITCSLMGGLGNQLFQIFTTISYSLHLRKKFVFLDVKILTDGSPDTTIRYTYWTSIFSNLKLFLTPTFHYDIIKKETFFNYIPITTSDVANSNVLLQGYFQSYKYFQDNFNTICSLLSIKQQKNGVLSKAHFPKNYLQNCISMHFRIGDYKKIQHCHPIMTSEYYSKCLSHIQSMHKSVNFTVMYFCEDVDIDDVSKTIGYLQTQFPNYEFSRGENTLEDWEQLLLMSCCHHNIIANSSFSWWGAYLNDFEDKMVCYPSIWFGPTMNHHNTVDLFPQEWHKIQA